MPHASSQRTLLQIVTSFCERAGVPTPTSVIGSGNQRVTQIRALLEEVGQYLVSEFNFQQLTRDVTFTSIAAESQGLFATIIGSEGAAFDRIIPGTFFDRTLRKEIFGAMSDRDWQVLKAAMVGGPLYQYRIADGQLLVNPTMEADHTCAFTWVSKNWIVDSGGTTGKYLFSADTDRPVFNDTLLLMGLRAYWAREKGLPYSDLMIDFESRAENESGRSRSSKKLDMAGGNNDIVPGIFVPSGNWNLP